MTRTLALNGLAAAIFATGLTLLVKPGMVRAWLRLPEGEPATYGLRIIGAMILASGLFLGGFSSAWYLAAGA